MLKRLCTALPLNWWVEARGDSLGEMIKDAVLWKAGEKKNYRISEEEVPAEVTEEAVKAISDAIYGSPI